MHYFYIHTNSCLNVPYIVSMTVAFASTATLHYTTITVVLTKLNAH